MWRCSPAGRGIKKLGLHQLARREHGAHFPRRQRFAMHRPKPTEPHQLGDALGILAAGLNRHGVEGAAPMTCLKRLDGKTSFRQTGIQSR